MSVQSDIELLSIMAIEKYSQLHGLSSEQATELFNEKHVMEEILLQHEYLHQIGFEEVMDFIEQVVSRENHLLLVYHGTVAVFSEIDLSKSHDRRDFGKGFYTTVLENQSKEWGYRLSLRYNKVNNQISFHTPKSLQALRLVERKSYHAQ